MPEDERLPAKQQPRTLKFGRQAEIEIGHLPAESQDAIEKVHIENVVAAEADERETQVSLSEWNSHTKNILDAASEANKQGSIFESTYTQKTKRTITESKVRNIGAGRNRLLLGAGILVVIIVIVLAWIVRG